MNKLVNLIIYFMLSTTSTISLAGEVGNPFIPQSEELELQARKASAQSISGVSILFTALKMRELTENTGSKLIEESASQLESAANQMIIISENPYFEDFKLSENDISMIESRLPNLPKDTLYFKQLYLIYANSIQQLSKKISSQSFTPLSERIFSEFSQNLEDYIALGDVISQISEAASSK